MKHVEFRQTADLAVRLFLAFSMVFNVAPAMAAPGDTVVTPTVPMEIPIEVEIELAPAASLKQAPLWKELFQMLEDPYTPVERRPGFGVTMPPLNVWPLDYNFLTGQTLRLRTSDGEVSWDQPGPMFDPNEDIATNAFSVPTELRKVIGELVTEDYVVTIDSVEYTIPDGSLVVRNPAVSTYHNLDGTVYTPPATPDPNIPPDGTVVAVSAALPTGEGGAKLLYEYDPATGDRTLIIELEVPVNEHHFFRGPDDTAGVDPALQPLIGRPAAEILGKALFWDMQVGSDGIQACASCHFHAGVDNRSRNQLNPNHLGGDLDLEVFSNRAVPPPDPQNPDQDVVASDFPFHKLVDINIPGEPLVNPGNVASDANDVMSSMGVIFRTFVDIPPIGGGSFGPAVMGVAPLLPDIGTADPDPIPVFQGVRRVEPRNTPTFHGAAFNFDNFWDGRARFHFNGGSVFGPSDPQFHIFVNDGSGAGAMHALPDPNDNELPLSEWAPALGETPVPVRIKFSSLASQAVGPPLSEFEMSFLGRNWPKIGKKMLQDGVTPLANQLVATTDSVLGPRSHQNTTVGMPGLDLSYRQLIQLAFDPQLWANTSQHFHGAPGPDPFDGYILSAPSAGGAGLTDTNQFTQMEANFSLFFGLAAQAYEELTIPDDTLFDQFMDANPLAANAVGEPGSLGVLHPALIPGLVGPLTLIPDDPSTPEYDGFGPEEVFGFDIFAGANLTAALPLGSLRNPSFTLPDGTPFGTGSNPFARTARCMLCHLGPEQTDHSINVTHGLLKGDAEYEFPTPPEVEFPPGSGQFLPAAEPPGPLQAVGGLILAEEIEEAAQDAVEVEPQNFATFDNPATSWDDRIVAQPEAFAFGDQGIYNIGVRPIIDDISRGGNDPFGWPLSLTALTLKNIAGPLFEPPDGPSDPPAVMGNFDPAIDLAGGLFEETGDGAFFPGTTYTLQSINPGFERSPIIPLMPEYMVPWMHSLPAGELHPQIDEMAGLAPNTITAPNGGPAVEFAEYIFGIDLHCGIYDPALYGAPGDPPNHGWGPRAPNNQSGVSGNIDYPIHGTWPMSNRVRRDGGFKAPSLRNIELTGPMFHTGSYLTLRQVVDFYIRGGDFPVTNAEGRDQHMVDIEKQAFGFGRTNSISGDLDLFADALPDTAYRYDVMPDTDHPLIPEPAYLTPENAKNAIVKFMLSLTDPRVKYARAPFDYPELFVPIKGTAPDNTGGRAALLADPNNFRFLPAVGAEGNATPLPNFLGVLSTPDPIQVDHFDSVIPLGPAEMIVDNLDATTSSVGVWLPSSASDFWATDSVWANDAGDSFTFPANLMPGTAYAVYEWHTVWPSRYTAVPHQIRSGATLLDTVIVDQLANGGQWNLLGVYTFADAAGVTVLATPGFSTNADAVRFVPLTALQSLEITGALTVDEGTSADCDAIAHFSGGISLTVEPELWDVDIAEASIDSTGLLTAGLVAADTPAVVSAQYTLNGTIVNDTHNITVLNSGGAPVEVIVDNLGATTSSVGVWLPSGASGYWATNSVWANDAGDSFTFTANLMPGIAYQVYEWHTVWPSRYTAVPHQIRSGATLLGTTNVNQQINGGQWNLLGTYTFNGPASVTVLATPGFSSCADAVRFVPVTTPVEVIVDNLDTDTSSVGVWLPSGASGFWATNSVWANDAGDSFTFIANLMLMPGITYQVYEWHTVFSNRNTAAPYEIRSGATLLATVNVNQQLNGSQWNIVGTYAFTDTASVTILASPGSSTNADAVRFVPVP